MENFGKFRVVGEPQSEGGIRFFRAFEEGVDGGKAVLVKVWTPACPDDRARGEFEAMVKDQATLVSKRPSASVWVPVLSSGEDERGRWVVTPMVGENLGRWLGTVTADSRLLRHVLLQVLSGLREIEKERSRCHGNLLPTKVLMEGSGPIAKRRIRLTEPSSAVIDTSGCNPDLRSLGELIFMLAGRTQTVRSRMRGVPDHTRWPRLGADENAWKKLCDDLLNPNGRFQREGLAGVRAAVMELGGGGGLIRPRVAGGVAVGLLVAALVALVFMGRDRDPDAGDLAARQYIAYIEAYDGWLRDFTRDFSRIFIRNLGDFGDDTYLEREVAGLLSQRGERIEPGRALGLDMRQADRTAVPATIMESASTRARMNEAHAFLGELTAALNDWPTLDTARDNHRRLRHLGWETAAAEVEMAVDGFRVGEGLLQRMVAVHEVAELSARLFRRWEDLAGVHERMRTTGDPFLETLVRRQMAETVAEAGDLLAQQALVEELRRTLIPVTRLIEGPDWPAQYAFDLFQERLREGAWGLPEELDIASWMAALEGFRWVPDPRVEQLASFRQVLEGIEGDILQLTGFELNDEATAFEAELAGLRAEMSAVARFPAIENELPAINSALRDIQSALNDLFGRLRAVVAENLVDPEEWLQTWRGAAAATSGPLAEIWRARRDGLLEGLSVAFLRENQIRMRDVERILLHLRGLLTELDHTLVPPRRLGPRRLPEIDGPLENYLTDLRTRTLEVIGAEVPYGDEIERWDLAAFLARTSVAAARVAYEAEVEAAGAFSAAFGRFSEELLEHRLPSPAFNEFLEREVMGSEGWIARVGLRPEGSAALTSMRRVHEAARSGSAGDLLALVRGGASTPAERWVAWARLREIGAQPTRADEWTRWGDAFAAFVEAVPTASAPALEGAGWWARATGASGDAETFRMALRFRPVFGGRVGDLPERYRFFDFILELRRLVGEHPDWLAAEGTAADLQASIVRRARDTFADGGQPEILAQFLADIEEIDPHEVGESIDYAVSGPGSLPGWMTNGPDADGTVTYRWSGYSLAFHPVELPDGATVYLGTTEVSVGVVVEWFGRNPGDWQAAAAALPESALRRVRTGPNTWTLNADGLPDYALRWQETSPRWDNDLYGQPPSSSRPTDAHPLQYIPPLLAEGIARALNSELPPPAAYQMVLSGVDVAAPVWNRRDRTWARQQDHIAQTDQRLGTFDPPWPDHGIFRPANLSFPTGASAEALDDRDDGELWFAPVDAGEPGPFAHIVGNVAEFARDPETGAFYVVGASALSPPEIEPRTLYPVPTPHDHPSFSDVGFRLSFTMPRRSPEALLVNTVRHPRFFEELFP